MLTISVRFLHGTFRADSDDVAITGQNPRGEWPPSPARLFSALVAGDGTGERSRVSDDEGLRVLERAAPPKIYADDTGDVLVSSLTDRYVVVDEASTGTVQEYLARTSRPVRPGTRRAMRERQVTYVWEDVSLDKSAFQGIVARAARVGYLGCADSPVTLRVGVSSPDDPVSKAWIPDLSGSESLPVPFDGLMDVLDDAFHRFTTGELVRRSWYASRRARYRSPSEIRIVGPEAVPSVIWLRLNPSVPGRKVLAVTETLRAACLEKFERHAAGSPEKVPPILHGHGFEGSGYQHACWLALPDVGYSWSRGRIYGAAIWLPPETSAAVVEGVKTSMRYITELVRPGHFRAALRLHSGEGKPLAARPDRWTGTSRVWTSAFPVVHENWQKGGPDLASVARWCLHAGLPEPIAFRSATVPLVPGAVSLMPHEARRQGKEFRPYSHVELTFPEPIKGPIIVGRGRQFGLGLMVPVDVRQPQGGER